MMLRRIPTNIYWLYGASLLAGGINYIYNIVMARDGYLGPTQFGALSALMALLSLEGIVASSLTTTVTNYVATFRASGQERTIGSFLWRLTQWIGIAGLVIAILFALASPLIATLLHLTSISAPLLVAPLVILTLISAITTGALQGIVAFGFLAILFLVSSLLRLILAITLVGNADWGVPGALLAALLATVATYGLSLIPLRHYFKNKTDASATLARFWTHDLLPYSQTVFLVTLGLTALFSLDVIFAQHFLSAFEASSYSSLSILGRMIYFVTLPISTMAFPIVSRRVATGRSSRRLVLIISAGLATATTAATALYALIPSVIIHWTIGSSYSAAAPEVWLFAAFFTIISLSTWLIHLFLAWHQTSIAYLPLACAILQVALISRFHTSSHAIIMSSLIPSSVLLLSLVTVLIFMNLPLKRWS